MRAITACSARNVRKISWAQRVSSFTLAPRLENSSVTRVNNCSRHTNVMISVCTYNWAHTRTSIYNIIYQYIAYKFASCTPQSLEQKQWLQDAVHTHQHGIAYHTDPHHFKTDSNSQKASGNWHNHTLPAVLGHVGLTICIEWRLPNVLVSSSTLLYFQTHHGSLTPSSVPSRNYNIPSLHCLLIYT